MKKNCISIDAVDRCIEKRSTDPYLSSFHPNGNYERRFDRIKYLISQKSNIKDVYYHNYMKIKIKSNNELPLEKTMSIQNTIIFIRLIFSSNYIINTSA